MNEKGIVSHQLPDGTIWVVGSSRPNSDSNMDVVAARIDTAGNILSNFLTFGSVYPEYPNNLICQNGKIIIAGEQHRPNDVNGFILVLDTAGNEISFAVFGQANQSEQFFDIEPTLDRGFVVSGFSSSGPGNDYLIGKFDSLQQLEWMQTYDLGTNESGITILENPMGGYVIAGDQIQFSGNFNIALLALDYAGSEIWRTIVASPHNSGCKSMVSMGDQMLIAGETATSTSSAFDIFLARVDWFGNVNWTGNVPKSDYQDACFDLAVIDNNEFVLTGYAYSTINQNSDMFAIAVDSIGNILSEEYFDNGNVEMGFDIKPNLYGGFITTDFTIEPSTGDNQFFISFPKLNLVSSVTQNINKTSAFNLYPNPTKSKVFLSYDFLEYDFQIFDILGKKYSFEKSDMHIDFQGLAPGIYFVVFSNKTRDKKYSRKVIKE